MDKIIVLKSPVLFLSDLHLDGTSKDQNVFKFFQLVDQHQAIKSLVLVGDVFDFHLGYQKTLYRHLFPLYQQLARWRDQGVDVHIFTGNHDPDIDPFLQEDLGIKIHQKAQVFTINQSIIRVEHGDQRDTHRIKKRICAFVRHPLTRTLAKVLPPAYYQYMVQRVFSRDDNIEARLSSDVPFPADLINNCWNDLPQVVSNDQVSQADTWIMGHYHRIACFVEPHASQPSPNLSMASSTPLPFSTLRTPPYCLPKDSKKLIFLGDWVHLNTFLYWDHDQVSLWTFKKDYLFSLPSGDHTSHILTHG